MSKYRTASLPIEEAIGWTGEDPQEFGDASKVQVAAWTNPGNPNRRSGYTDCVVFVPEAGRACHVSNGDPVWFDAETVAQAAEKIQLGLVGEGD